MLARRGHIPLGYWKDEEKTIVEQPIYMLPLPSPVCHVDFDYNAHGDDWKGCNCQETNQSPIDLPDPKCMDKIKRTPKFQYNHVSKDEIFMIYQYNILRLRSHASLGTVLDIDGTRYEVSEV